MDIQVGSRWVTGHSLRIIHETVLQVAPWGQLEDMQRLDYLARSALFAREPSNDTQFVVVARRDGSVWTTDMIEFVREHFGSVADMFMAHYERLTR